MVGDYVSTSLLGGGALTVFAVGKAPTGSTFDEAMYAPASSLTLSGGAPAKTGPIRSRHSDRAVAGAATAN
jgi:hypothetical protein